MASHIPDAGHNCAVLTGAPLSQYIAEFCGTSAWLPVTEFLQIDAQILDKSPDDREERHLLQSRVFERISAQVIVQVPQNNIVWPFKAVRLIETDTSNDSMPSATFMSFEGIPPVCLNASVKICLHWSTKVPQLLRQSQQQTSMQTNPSQRWKKHHFPSKTSLQDIQSVTTVNAPPGSTSRQHICI